VQNGICVELDIAFSLRCSLSCLTDKSHCIAKLDTVRHFIW